MRYVKVKARAGAKKELVGRKGPVLFIAVKEPAEDNRANRRVRELVARESGVPLAVVRLVSGHHAPSKLFVIMGKHED